MKHILLFEKFTTEYKGYLTGSLAYLYKHKRELENKISNIDNKIKISKESIIDIKQSTKGKLMSNVNRLLSTDEIDNISSLRSKKNKLQEELDNVNSEILKYTKK